MKTRNGTLTLYKRNEVLQTMEQICFVIDASLPLCDRVLESGELPTDREIDSAFGVREALH